MGLPWFSDFGIPTAPEWGPLPVPALESGLESPTSARTLKLQSNSGVTEGSSSPRAYDTFPKLLGSTAQSPKKSSKALSASHAPENVTMQRPVPLRRTVTFAQSPNGTHSVQCIEYGAQPYSEVYGMHPRLFDFDEFGNKVLRGAQYGTASVSASRMRNDSDEDVYASWADDAEGSFVNVQRQSFYQRGYFPEVPFQEEPFQELFL